MKLSSLQIWFSLLVFAAFAAVKYFVEIPMLTHSVIRGESEYLERYLSMRAVMIQSAMLENNYQLVRDWATIEGANPETKLLLVVDSKGTIIASSHLADEGKKIDASYPELKAATTIFDESLRTSVHASQDQRQIIAIAPMMTYALSGRRDLYPAFIYLQRDLNLRWQAVTRILLSGFITVGATCLFISVVFITVFRRRIRRRVEAINLTTELYMAGSRTARVNIDGKDEISKIGSGINRMLEAISAQNEQIAELAYRDQATKLLNRNGLVKAIVDISAEEGVDRQWVFFMLSIDGMHSINVSFGFEMGDALLVKLAQLLKQESEHFALVAYTSANRFLLARPLTQDMPENHARFKAFVESCAERMTLEAPVELPTVTISTGIFTATLREPLLHIIGSCELSLRQAKLQGVNQIHLMDQNEQHNLVRKSRLLHELSTALDANELHLVFQPKVTLSSGKTASAECLIRWIKPDGEMVSPAEFIPLAETGKLITKLDYWVLSRACQHIRAWQIDGKKIVPVAVNVSARTFYSDEFISRVKAIIDAYKIDPHLLEIEITEYNAIKDVVIATRHISELEEFGVLVAIDDFGMGNSNLDILLTLPVQHIKIDQSFIRASLASRRGEQILSSLVSLARSLGLTITAEGVEQYDQVEYLKRLGCTQAQGYFFAKPLGEREFLHFVESSIAE